MELAIQIIKIILAAATGAAAGGLLVFLIITGVLYFSQLKTQYEKYQDWCKENKEIESW